MAVMLIQEPTMPLTAEMYDATASRLDLDGNPPDGLISHAAGSDESGQWRIVDVWESKDAYDRFRSDRLLPAIAETGREFGMDPVDGPRVAVFEAHHVVAPAPVHAHA